jgi:hypothetical protein
MCNAVYCPLKFSSVPISVSMENSLTVARRTVELRDDYLVSVSASLDREETERPSFTATATNTSAEPYRSSNARESNQHASAGTKDEFSIIIADSTHESESIAGMFTNISVVAIAYLPGI